MIESPEKSKSFDLQQTDTQRGYFFDRTEVDPSFYELFGAVGRLENGGSGFIVEVEEGLLLMSARHCLKDLFRGRPSHVITMPDGYSFPIYLKDMLNEPINSRGSVRDIFILRLPHDVNPDNLPFRLRLQDKINLLKISDICFAIGYPNSYIEDRDIPGPVLSAGRILEQRSTTIMHTSRVEPGSSGCPVLDLNGKVIGINVDFNIHLPALLISDSLLGIQYNSEVRGFAEIASF